MLMLRTPLFFERKYRKTLILVYGASTTVLWPLLRGHTMAHHGIVY